MTMRDEFDKAWTGKSASKFYTPKRCALWAAEWALKKAEDACMSPTSKGRIRLLLNSLTGEKL